MLAWLTPAMLASAPAPGRATFQFVGDVGSVLPSPQGMELGFTDGSRARLQLYARDVVRIRWSPSGAFSSRSTGIVQAPPDALVEVQVVDAGDRAFLVSRGVSVIVRKSPLEIAIVRGDGSLVAGSVPGGFGADRDDGLVVALHRAPAGEAYLGMGQRGGPVNRRGRGFYMMNVDRAGYEEFTDPLYSTHPFYYAIDPLGVHGVFLDNAAVPFFDFDSAGRGHLVFGALKGELDYYVLVGPTPADVAWSFARLTGPATLPPLWSLGYHQSRYGYASQAEMEWLAEAFRSLRIPCDALYLDLDYMQDGALFTWNGSMFPAPAAMNDRLQSRGFRRVNIFDASLRVTDPLWPDFAAAGLLLRRPDGSPAVNSIFVGDVGWIDFTHPQAREEYVRRSQAFLATGVSGTWIDLNEPAQNFMPDALYDFGGDPRLDLEGRNLYALHHARTHYEAQERLRPRIRPWVLSRGGVTGIQRYAANWSGDTRSSFDSLRVSVQMTASMGLSGQDQFGHDVGGFLGSPSPELFVRWLEFGSLTPLFRTHAMNTSERREPWSFGEPYTTLARSIIEERYRRLPHLYSLFGEAQRSGAPVAAPTAFHFPTDPSTYAQDGEFMLGPDVLVAPVVSEGASSREVYLPAGTEWVNPAGDEVHPGGRRVQVPAPLGRIPVFVRRGAILPSGPLRQHVGEAVAERLTLDVYVGPPASFTLYEDDGETVDWKGGAVLRTRVTAGSEAAGPWLRTAWVEGSWRPPDREWVVRFHLVPRRPGGVAVDGVVLPEAPDGAADTATGGWTYDAAQQLLTVLAPGHRQPGVVAAAP